MSDQPPERLLHLGRIVARAAKVPDLPEDAKLAALAFVASVPAGGCWLDAHTNRMLACLLRGLTQAAEHGLPSAPSSASGVPPAKLQATEDF